MTYIPTLLHAIETRLDQTTAEITHLEAALSALTTTTTAATVTRPPNSVPKKQRRRASTTRTRRSPDPAPAVAAAPPAAPSITNTISPDPSPRHEPTPTAAAPTTSAPEQSKPIATDAAATAPTTRWRPSTASASRRKRAATKLDAETLRQLVADSTGALSATQIADQAGASYPATLKLLRELEASGQVRRSGERRSTSWRVITDEDRIAERVAELERAATAPSRRRGRARSS